MELRLKYPPSPEHAAEHAELAAEAAKRIRNLVLDYSNASVGDLDLLIGDFSREVEKSEFASTLFCFGCYLGEVIIRDQGGTWVRTEDSAMRDLSSWPMVVETEKGTWNPIGRVFKRFEDGEGEDLRYFLETVRREGYSRT